VSYSRAVLGGPPALTRVLRGLVAIAVGTRDESLFPACATGVGFSYDPLTHLLTVFVPEATGKETFENIAGNSAIAVVMEEVLMHRAVQLKGRCVEMRSATAAEKETVESCMNGFFYQVESVGMAREAIRRKNRWPCRALIIEIREVFEQTPGPEAGARFAGSRGA